MAEVKTPVPIQTPADVWQTHRSRPAATPSSCPSPWRRSWPTTAHPIFTGDVDEVAAQLAHHEIEGEHHHGPDGKHPKGIECQIGHYLVVDVHGEQRAGDGKQVDQDGRDQYVPIDATGFKQSAPEPVPVTGLQYLGERSSNLNCFLTKTVGPDTHHPAGPH